MPLKIKSDAPPSVVEALSTTEAKAEKAAGPSAELMPLLAKMAEHEGVVRYFAANKIPPVQRIQCGIYEVDYAIGGGFPKNRLIIIYGPQGSGKSNLAMKLAAAVQRLKEHANKVVWVDLEGTFDPAWVALFGLDMDALIVIKPGYGEQAADYIDAVIQASDVGLVVVDSIAIMTGVKELDKSMDKGDVGTAAMLVKRLCNKIAFAFSNEQVRGHFPTVLFINQTRFKIGVMFGNPETQPGGNTMLFNAALILRVSGKNEILATVNPNLPAFKDTKLVIHKAKVGVNQMETDYKMCVYPHDDLAVGDTKSWDMVKDRLQALGHIGGKSGQWTYDNKVFKTLAPLHDAYYSNPEVAEQMQKLIYESVKTQFTVEVKGGDHAAGG